MNNNFIRHFRIYFKNNHPAYIVDEEGNVFVFHRVTHSKTSGGKKNWEFDNPLKYGGKGKNVYCRKRAKGQEKQILGF